MQEINRRRFLKTTIVGGLTLVAFSRLSGCANSRASQNEDEQSSNEGTKTNQEQSTQDQNKGETNMLTSNSKSLVVVFSWSGNTLKVANHIKDMIGSAFFRIEAKTPYSSDYNECVDYAKEEQNKGTLPEYVGDVQNFDEYDTIYIGDPIWWYDVPQIIKTFAGNHNWNAKTVIPFCTSGGSSISSGLDNLKNLCKGANFKEGITISGSRADSSNSEVDSWLSGLGVA